MVVLIEVFQKVTRLVGYPSCLENLVVAGIRKLIDVDSIDSHIRLVVVGIKNLYLSCHVTTFHLFFLVNNVDAYAEFFIN